MVSYKVVGLATTTANSYEVVKNPLSPTEHPKGAGVNCELFELGVEQFVVSFYIKTKVYASYSNDLHRQHHFKADYRQSAY